MDKYQTKISLFSFENNIIVKNKYFSNIKKILIIKNYPLMLA